MNILREVRRATNKSMPVRLILLVTFCTIFIITTYAWFSTQKDVRLGSLESDLTPWDVNYYVDENQVFDKVVTFTINELYPGMPDREDVVNIYNIAETSSSLKYELTSVKVFGQEVLDELNIGVQGNTTTIFSADTNYPFKISYTYDKDYMTGAYNFDNPEESSEQSHATFKFNVDWTYEGTGTEEENLAKDVLDTKFGKDAYQYYKNEANDPSKAIEVKVRITSKMIHPKTETE